MNKASVKHDFIFVNVYLHRTLMWLLMDYITWPNNEHHVYLAIINLCSCKLDFNEKWLFKKLCKFGYKNNKN